MHPIYVNENEVQCEKCLKAYSSVDTLREHLKVFHFNVKPKCFYCDKIFETRFQLSVHVKSFHAEEHKNRFKHFQKRSIERVPCEQCGKMISTTNMASHLRSHEEHVCDKCGKSFPSQAKLRHHEEDVHEDGHFVCDECGKVCNSQRILNAHQKQHKVVKVPTPCTVQGCKFVCSSKQTLFRHLQTHKPKNERTTYPCKYCPKFYFSRKVRDEHEKGIHLGIKNYKCDQCDASYEFSLALMNHKRTQHSGIMYSCDYPGCTKSYNAKGNLDAHRKRVHKIARPKELLN